MIPDCWEELNYQLCKALNTLKANGAHHLQRVAVSQRTDTRLTLFWGAVVAAVVALGVLVLLIAYGVIRVSFPTQMADQPSIASQEGPRLAAPAAAVPVQGPVLIASQPATEPVSVTADSLQRGKVLYGVTCIVCHGESGKGDGKLSGFFSPRPANLTSDAAQSLSDAEIFLVITQGRGIMPSLAENLSAQDRWDVINYMRTLKK